MFNFWSPFSQLSTIASQSSLGAELLSQAFDSAPTEPSSADSQKEPISVEITDAPTTAENVSFFHFILDACWSIFWKVSDFIQFPSFIWFLAMLDTSRGNTYARAGVWQSPYWNDPVVADIQSADFLVQHTTDGKKVICLVYFSAINMN